MIEDAPGWASGATKRSAFLRGLRVAGSTPGAVLFATALGFGALARDVGVTFSETVLISAAIYALPAQVMLVDQLARGAALAAAAFAVSLTAVRLLPMTVALLPHLKDERGLRPIHFLAAHFVAVTAWLEGNRRLPLLPEHLRLAHFIGIGLGMLIATAVGSAIGHVVSASLPPAVSAALLFMTPIYFLLSLLSSAARRTDWLAVGLGVVLGPLLYLFVPGPDLMLTGVIGGTVAWWMGAWWIGAR